MFWGKPPFNPETDISDLSGKVIIVTGGNTGLGKETIMELVKHKPKRVFLAARTASKAEAAISEIKAMTPDANVTHLSLDLMSFDSIKNASSQFQSQSDRLDVLLNNAGIMATPPAKTTEGYESQFGTNHMGHALFTKLLLPTLLKTAEQPNSDVRIVNLTSEGHNMAPTGGIIFDTDKLLTYGAWTRYGQSKLANVLFTKGLAKHYPQITSVSVHPGVILTDLYAAQNQNVLFKYSIGVVSKFAFSGLKQGTFNSLWACTAEKDKLENGAYYKPVGLKSAGSPMTGYARDEKLADQLWDWTEEEFKKHGI
ncbi:NAD(P)-binding protein [Tothia fuscella]|uniref:NAD(P)-binding protein n=1 Tax=Tothia fuscella TaxID=1048955 RepID=A0A9P4NPA1_9PEZI|nr:NAD(P)-binding protein [Tothia fuscella]